jgi:hypothetical protein
VAALLAHGKGRRSVNAIQFAPNPLPLKTVSNLLTK